jgi:hypothetical protein
MMSRWCDQSIPDERHSAFSSGPLEVAVLFGTLVAETILASVHVRAHKQAGHMDASDLIKTLQNTLQGGGRPHMENRGALLALPDYCAMKLSYNYVDSTRPRYRQPIHKSWAVLEDLFLCHVNPHRQHNILLFDNLTRENRIKLDLCPAGIIQQVWR